MHILNKTIGLAGLAAFGVLGAQASAQSYTMSTGLGQPHMWTAYHMEPFAEAMEERSDGEISFTKFYGGELAGVGRSLDSLQSGVIDIAAPLLAPYHEGRFPLSDVTQLPTYGTDSPMVTRAFQALLDSDVELAGGQTFYDYEIADKGIRVWALGATGPYSISTTSKVLAEPEDFTGTPLRAGSALHTIALENLGATPVALPGPQAYEALSRKTIDGIIIAISDWPSYSIQELLRHSIVDLSIGHWESYLAISDEAWDRMSEENQQVFDQTAREIALFNANKWNENGVKVQEESATNDGGSFVSINDLSQAMQDHIADAGRQTWIDWIEKTEAAGHPARATAQLYAELIQAEGGALPDGVAEYLAD
jgi:TRAP-type C4-dicarboxylate transport system substrate-binding protein